MVFRKLGSDEERFWSRVNRRGPVPANRPDLGPCWLWLGSHIRGYGQFQVGSRTDGSRRMLKAHRFAYELEETIPDGLTLDHLCRTTLCVRPTHLEAVTIRVNVLRGDTPPTRNAAKAVCLRGHPFDAMRGKRRACLTCERLHMRAFRARHPEQQRKPLEGAALERHRAKAREYTRAYRARRREHLVSA